MTLDRLRRMLSGDGSLARGPDPSRPRGDSQGSLGVSQAEAPTKQAQAEELRSRKLSPSLGRRQEAWAAPGLLPTSERPGTSARAATGSLARLGRRREARLPFSRFLDEVAVRVLDPGTLEAFRGARSHSSEPSPAEPSPDPAQEPLAGAAAPEDPARSPRLSSEVATGAARGAGPGRAMEAPGPPVGRNKQGGHAASPQRHPGRASAADMEKLRLRSPWVPSCLGQPRVLHGRLAKSSPSLWDSALQEQKGELRKRLSYTTHKLEKLETEFDSTRHYLEIELRRAQEELEKVTEKLRRIQSNYLALQRINQELEGKLYRMGQHYEEEKRALSHEIVALNSHLLEAKVTIDKLSEDNELYRKDCSLAAQLLQCSQTHGRVHKVSELPSDFLEEHGCSSSSLCHSACADAVPPCVLAKVLGKADPSSLSDASAGDLTFQEEEDDDDDDDDDHGAGKPGSRAPYKGDIYCSDTALYCSEERRRDRRPSVDPPVADVGFLHAQNSTDSTVEEEEEAEAAAYPSSFRREAFPGYAASLPTSSSYSSFSATSEEKEHPQPSTLTASQQAIYLSSRDELFSRKPPAAAAAAATAAAYDSSPRFPQAATAPAAIAVATPREAEAAPRFGRTLSPYQAEPFQYPATPGPQQALMPPNLWTLRAKPAEGRLCGENIRGQWRPLSVEDIGAYSFPPRPAGRASPCSISERYYGSASASGGACGGASGSSPTAEGRASPLYASYKADSFSEGDDLSQGHLAEPCFLRAGGDLSLSPSRSADQLPSYASGEGERERLGVQLCGAVSSPEPGSRDSLEPSSMEASPEMHPAARLSPQQAFPRTGGSGLSRKDSLTKAQLYGTLLN